MKYCRVNRIRCKRCGDVLEHVNQKKEQPVARVMYCACGAVGLDPGAIYYRILASSRDDFEDLSEAGDEET